MQGRQEDREALKATRGLELIQLICHHTHQHLPSPTSERGPPRGLDVVWPPPWALSQHRALLTLQERGRGREGRREG